MDPYKVLGVPRDVDQRGVRRAYMQLALRLHPDKAPGREAEFTAATRSYNVLSDPQARAYYDQHGTLDVPGTTAGASAQPLSVRDQAVQTYNEVYRAACGWVARVFGAPAPPPQAERVPGQVNRTDTYVIPVTLTLEQLYQGAVRSYSCTRTVLCDACRGSGAASARDVCRCRACSGKGVVLQQRQLGHKLVQTRAQRCRSCDGTGQQVAAVCPGCGGRRTRFDTRVLTASFTPGMAHGDRITLDGASDQEPGCQAGDVVFLVQEAAHSRYKRHGADLYLEYRISLRDALVGFTLSVPMITGAKRRVAVEPVVAVAEQRALPGLGMPVPGVTGSFGRLVLIFHLDMPPVISTDLQRVLRAVSLTGATSQDILAGVAIDADIAAANDGDEDVPLVLRKPDRIASRSKL